MTPGGRSNRDRGDYFERQTVAALRAVGWYVIRSAGSLGVADVVALRRGHTPLLVSCKLSGRLGPAQRSALLGTADGAGARPVLATRLRNGYVDLSTVHHGTATTVPLDTLKVPARPDKSPTRDHLNPPGVQLVIPTD